MARKVPGQRGVGAEGRPGRPTRCPRPPLRVRQAWPERGQNWPGPCGDSRAATATSGLRVQGGAGCPRFGPLANRSTCWGVSSGPHPRGLGAGALRPGCSPILRGGHRPPQLPRPGPPEATGRDSPRPCLHACLSPTVTPKLELPRPILGTPKSNLLSYRGESLGSRTPEPPWPALAPPPSLLGWEMWAQGLGRLMVDIQPRRLRTEAYGAGGRGRAVPPRLQLVSGTRQGSPREDGSLADPPTTGTGHQVPAPGDKCQG